MANFFDQFDAVEPSSMGEPTARITVTPSRPQYADAISSIESGGNYRAIGPRTKTGDRAVGRYQIMGANVGPWTEEVLGSPMTPLQFAASPEAQDAVFKAKFGGYVDKYGPEGAARAWFAGEGGMNDPNRKDVLGTSVADYSRKFTAAMPQSEAQAAPDAMAYAGEPQPQPQPAAIAPAPVASAPSNFFDQFDGQSKPFVPQQPDSRPDVGQGTAAMEGFLSGASGNFRDEIYGASEASGLPKALGGFRAPVGAAKLLWEYLNDNPAEATAIYEKARDQVRTRQKAAEEQYPGTTLAGNVAGAVALPTGRLMQAATLPARIGRGAAVGAGYGAIAGAGEGTGLQDRASRGAVGGAAGGVIGAAGVPVVEGIIQAGRAVARPVTTAIRGAVNPEGEAARRIGVALEHDINADPGAATRLTPQEFAANAQNNGPARIMDIGSDATRALARSAANTSPEGRGVLSRAIDERFEGQSPRIAQWLRHTFHFPSADAQQTAIEQTARAVNTPNYARAMRDGAQGVWDQELQRLAGAPAVQEAAGRAMPSLANRGVAEGFAAPRQNPLTFDPQTGLASLSALPNGSLRVPDLRFWDQVKRNLDGMIGVAQRANDRPRVSELTGIKNELVQNLDRLVPSYAQARAGAAHFFGAENALEAGQNFVGASQRYGLPEARAALGRMTANERQLFQDGYVSRLVETIERAPDRRNVLNQIAQSGPARQEIQMALGPQRAAELEAMLRVEGIMDLARGAVQGNSTTARQLVELGLAGGVGGYGYLSSDPAAVMNAALVWGAARGHRAIDARVAQRVAQMLTSRDPQVLMRGVQMVARNHQLLNQLRNVDVRLASAGSGQAAPAPMLQLPAPGRAEDQPEVPRPPGQ